jgi:hypothetical protein
VGCRAAKLGTRRGCRPGESAHPSKRRRSLRECSAARQEAVSGGGAGRSVRPFAGAHVGPSRGHSKRHGLLRSSAGVRLVVPGSGVRSASLSTTLPCSGRAPAVCQHESEIHDFHSSPGATARAAEGTVVRPGPASPERAWVAGPRNSAVDAGVGQAGQFVQRIDGGRSGNVPRPGKKRSAAGESGASSRLRSAPMSVLPPVIPSVTACRGRRPAFGSSFVARAFAQHRWAQHCLAADARLRFARMTRKYTTSILQPAPRRAPLKAPLGAM